MESGGGRRGRGRGEGEGEERERERQTQKTMSAFAESFAQSESTRPFDDDDSYAGYNSQPFDDSFATGDDVLESQPPIYGQFSPQENGEFGGSEGRISLSPSETEAEQGLALIEWRRYV